MDFENVLNKQKELKERVRFNLKRNVPRWYNHEDARYREKQEEVKVEQVDQTDDVKKNEQPDASEKL